MRLNSMHFLTQSYITYRPTGVQLKNILYLALQWCVFVGSGILRREHIRNVRVQETMGIEEAMTHDIMMKQLVHS